MGNGNGLSAVLKTSVAGNPYVDRDLQAFAGKQVPIERVEVRAMDREENLHLVVNGRTGSPLPLALVYFESYPPVEELRKIAVKV